MKNKLKVAAFFLCTLLLLTTATKISVVNAEDETLIKVGLGRNLSVAVLHIETGNYSLKDQATGVPINQLFPGDSVQFNKVGTSVQIVINGVPQQVTYRGPIIAEAIDKQELNIFTYGNIKYRDNFRILNDAHLAVVNILSVEKYLYGVVGPEMGLAAPLEALKAQAVISRSYALNLMRPTNNWDVGVDTATQVYRGYSAELLPGGNNAIKAVNETRGQVIYHQFNPNGSNRPIAAFFHANSGGYTENSENVWLNPVPYIKATPSPYDNYALTYPHQDSSGWPANSYQWTTKLSRLQLLDRINQWNTNNINNKNALILVGQLDDIQISKEQRDSQQETKSGRVTRVEFIGTEGTASVYRDQIRSIFGLKSTLFELKLDSQLYAINENYQLTAFNKGNEIVGIGGGNNRQLLNSGGEHYFVIARGDKLTVKPKVFENITIEGKGHGHGLGMSQWGAMGMAAAGHNYLDIIKHYYNQDGNITIREYIRSF